MTTNQNVMAAPAIDTAATTSKGLNIGLWVAQVLGAAMFLTAGGSKLSGAPQMVGLFNAIGIGQWFRYVTGGLEVLGAVLLLVPALSGVGGALLVPVMIGAVITHLAVVGGSPAMPLVLMALMAFVAWGRRDRTLKLIGR